MTAALRERTTTPAVTFSSRRELSTFISGMARQAGATNFLILDTAPVGTSEAARIVASDWIYDTVQWLGHDAIARLGENKVSTFPGTAPRGWHPVALAALLDCREIGLLAELGHHEIFSLRLHSGTGRFVALFSARLSGSIDTAALSRAQVMCGYALSRFESDRAPRIDDPLSERERECLRWVSEGKTTEDIALILDVSANTVNSYIAHAIHKLAANNRPMAIATAIRRGII